MRILIVDDEEVALTTIRRLLKRRGYKDVQICSKSVEALSMITDNDFDLVLLDILMPELDGLKVLESAKPKRPYTEFIILTAVQDVATAVSAIRMGAYDYLIKPVDPERLFLSIERAYERIGLLAGFTRGYADGHAIKVSDVFSDIVTQSSRMKELLSYTEVMARSGNPILITGESGTGKELLARGIHRGGPNPDGPFIAVNVSSVPEMLFESQFFGYAKGAFTGAHKDYKGYFEQADGGTLFLDEVGELPLYLQPKLLRILEEKRVTPLGKTIGKEVDVRIVSATNTDLNKACQEGKFRLDFMYRIGSARVHLPPLSDRREDIPILVEHFLRKACVHHGMEICQMTPDAMDMLTEKDYPGNIRELAQVVEHAALVAGSSTILPHHLGQERIAERSLVRSKVCSLKENSETHVAYVLSYTKGDRKRAAQILGITVRQLQRKLADMRKNLRWSPLISDL
ncbi:MAG: sigma-54 dependent transcriptional regulator [Pseudomonadota bacterium]